MGLDQYLNRKTYIGNKFKDKAEQTIVRCSPPLKALKKERITYIEEEVAYWRKANAIHKWFVDNVQDGNDNCKLYAVDQQHLKMLLSLINQVLDDRDKAKELLPTQEGFFFGSTDYDEDYFEELKDTKKILTNLLAEPESQFGYEYTYQSSW